MISVLRELNYPYFHILMYIPYTDLHVLFVCEVDRTQDINACTIRRAGGQGLNYEFYINVTTLFNSNIMGENQNS